MQPSRGADGQCSMIPMIQNKYETIIKDLDNIQNEFTKTELKWNLNTDEQFEQLKTIRKKITHFLLHSRQQSNKSCKFTDNNKKHYTGWPEKTSGTFAWRYATV